MTKKNTPTEVALLRACGCTPPGDYDCYMCDLGGWAGTPHRCPGNDRCRHDGVRRLLATGRLTVTTAGEIVPSGD